jgi:hypothetical protein
MSTEERVAFRLLQTEPGSLDFCLDQDRSCQFYPASPVSLAEREIPLACVLLISCERKRALACMILCANAASRPASRFGGKGEGSLYLSLG